MTDNDTATGISGDRFEFVLAAAALTVALLLLVDLPAEGEPVNVWEVVATLLTGVTLVLALVVSGVAKPLRSLGVGAAVVFIALTLVSLVTDWTMVGFSQVFWVLLIVATPFIVLRRLLLHRVVTREILLGAASVYLLIAITFVFLFLAIDRSSVEGFFGRPEPSTGFMYFTLVTMTTLGYGDLAPVTQVARAASGALAIVGQVYLVFVVARLVGLYTSAGNRSITGE